jgi:beta-mannosidase
MAAVKGPELMTCGPYRPIRLLAYDIRIDSIDVHAIVDTNLSCSLSGTVTVEGIAAAVRVRIQSSQQTHVIWESEIRSQGERVEIKVDLADAVDLWWPAGSGAQTRYRLAVELLDDVCSSALVLCAAILPMHQEHRILDMREQNIGFRRIELVQEPLHEADQYGTGTTFFFRVNGVPIFAGGSCSLSSWQC